jgi:RNA polymerase sigma-70 factor (ECF subfamily)
LKAGSANQGDFFPVEDRKLIERAQRGDKDAFAALAQRYHRNIYSLAYRMTGNREDAMDITQEVLLRAFRAIASFQPDKPFLPWIYRITWNICADRGRKIGRTPAEESIDDGNSGASRLASSTPGPDTQFEKQEVARVLREAIDQLAEGYRELIILFHLEGLSIREISDVTDMKETVIKNRLYRGRQMLKKILEAGGFVWTV